MNRSTFYISAGISVAAAAWLGWTVGQPSATASVKKSTKPVSGAVPPVEALYHAVAQPDYDARRGMALAEVLKALDAVQREPFSQATVDDSVNGVLFSMLQSLKPEEIPEVLEHLAALPPPAPDRLLATVLGRWARHDGAAAMQWAARLPAARMETVRGDILSGWGYSDPQAAWAWYQKAWEAAPEPRYRLEQDFTKLIHSWALRDAKGAMGACLAQGKHGTYGKWSGFASLVALPERRGEIMALISDIPDEKERNAASKSAMLQWSASAPVEAAAWLDANMPKADSDLVWSIAERFGRANPRANADWLLRRTPPEKRDEAYRLCLYQWTEHAPEEAAAWLEGAGVTDMSAEIIATRFARTDLAKAMTWARRVSPAKRTESIVNTLAQAQIAGQKPDFAGYASDAGLTTEDLAKKVEEQARVIGSRL